MRDKHSQLIEASIDLFSQEGFWNTPTARIAKHAGVATGTLFNYFESKDALIAAVYMQLKHEWITFLEKGFPHDQDFKTKFEHIWFQHIQWGINNPDRYTLMHQLRISNYVAAEEVAKHDSGIAFLQQLVLEAYQQNVFTDVPLDYLSDLMEAQLDTAVAYALSKKLSGLPLSRHMTQGFEIAWRSIKR